MEINLSKPDRWGFRWLRGFVGKSWGTQVGLVGISIVAGALLFGSWQMPFPSQAAISQSHEVPQVKILLILLREDFRILHTW